MEHDEDDTPRGPMGCRSMMQQMLERMCATNDWNPAAMCQRMMASMGTAKDTGAPPAPEGPVTPCARRAS